MNAPADDKLPAACDAYQRRWARAQLGLPDEATPEEERAAVFRHLEATDFLPPPSGEQAAFLLCAAPEALRRRSQEELLRAREIDLKPEVDRLAEHFFDMPVEERHARWQALTEQCSFSLPLRTRLEALADGLDFQVPQGEPTSLEEKLIRQISQAFVLAPSQREAYYEEIRRQAAADPRRWQAAARVARDRCPPCAALAPQLMGTLCDFVRARKIAVKAEAQRRKALARQASPRRESGGAPWWWLVPVVLCASNFLGRMNSSPSPPPPKENLPRQVFSQPAPTLPPTTPSLLTMFREAAERPVLPPRDPQAFPGEALNRGKVVVDKRARRMFHIPEDVDVFREDGKIVFRRQATEPPNDPKKPSVPGKSEVSR